MRFIDNIGHIFSMQSYSELPIGYEYEQTPYIFWIDNEYSQKLSINNYYLLPVRFLVKSNFFEVENNIVPSINISVKSDIFKLYCPDGELGNAAITENDMVNEITDINKLNCISGLTTLNPNGDTDEYSIYTFYVIASAKEEGTWTTNVLIYLHGKKLINLNKTITNENGTQETITINTYVDTDNYCPITVGGTFIDEIEQLVINAQNIGVSLPKSIIKAVYQYQYNTDIIDENVYNTKLKEYLINHMQLKAECGNYNAVLRAIDWFGWKNKVNIIKHLKTDNQFIEQFINDYFNIEDDIIAAYKNFKTTAYMSLFVKENEETNVQYNLNFTNDFWGEGKPELLDLFDYEIYTERDGINFYKQYYDYTFKEMGIKLSCMADMLKKYFLPVHLSIKDASLRHQVFANDIKLLNNTYIQITEQPIFASDKLYENKTFVSFDNINIYYLSKQSNTFIDNNFNRFEHYTNDFCNSDNTPANIYWDISNIISTSIPIKFTNISDSVDTVYNCNIILESINKDNDTEHVYLHTSNFSFTNKEIYKEFILAPQLFDNKVNISYWENNRFILHVQCNGTWYKKEFTIKIPDFQLIFGELKYNYESDRFRQISHIDENNTPKFLSSMYLEDLVTINNAHFIDEFERAYNISKDEVIKYVDSLVERIKISNSRKYYNRIHVYNLSLKSYSSDNKDKLTYTNENDLSIYLDFFNNDGTQKYWLYNNDNQLPYDFYLMRDADNKYYCVFISQDTIDSKNIIDESMLSIKYNGLGIDNYNFTKLKSDDIFLINRMILIPDEGIHKFDVDSIIVASINNIDLPFIFSLGTKWEFKNISVGSSYINKVTSKTNIAIMSIPDNQIKYAKGYYDVTVLYTIDNYHKVSKTITQRICIK